MVFFIFGILTAKTLVESPVKTYQVFSVNSLHEIKIYNSATKRHLLQLFQKNLIKFQFYEFQITTYNITAIIETDNARLVPPFTSVERRSIKTILILLYKSEC